jgi:uncharacterized protein with von Willebrand factor type A (vWA) domain
VAEGAGYDAVDSLVGLAAVLRAMGVDASTDRAVAAVSALHELDPVRKADVYWAGRLTLCGTPDDLVRYDVAFDAYFGDRPGAVVRRQRLTTTQLQLVAEPGPGADGSGEDGEAPQRRRQQRRAAAAPRRQGDDLAEKQQLAVLLAALRLPGERRTTRRLRPSARGTVDGSARCGPGWPPGGEPARLRHRSPRPGPAGWCCWST